MNRWFFIPLFSAILFIGKTYSLEMIAEIKEPVLTEFGTYVPYLIDVEPDAPVCNPGENLENVINLGRFSLSDSDLDMLKRNHFLVKPAGRSDYRWMATGYNEMFDIYCENREHGIPIFVTTDAMLHSFHLCFDYILRTCEEKRFIGQLERMLTALLQKTVEQYEASSEERIRAALILNLDYLIVAKKLLDPSYVEPINGGHYLQELELIQQAGGFSTSPIFGYEEDYSQYIVRGHYTRSDSLKRYFKSMMWLGRMTFSCEDKSWVSSREATRRAILLVQAMADVSVDEKPALDVWDDIYQPTVFFVGKSDDINFYQYIPFAEKVYGEEFGALDPDSFADETLLTAFLIETEALKPADITYPGQPAKGFRFMGQRFIPDSWILDELVFDKIPARFMPTGLDVMIVLGSERAYDYLNEADKNNSFYLDKLEILKETFKAYPSDTWAQNAYWNWLYCLMPLVEEKGEGYPFFMQTSAWLDKDLYAALASWAELRHDTILYAKQSGTETSIPPSALEIQGYVEPNPHFFGRIASLAYFMIEGLKSRQLLFDNFESSLDRFAQLALDLKAIAEKELTGRPLSSVEYQTIFDIGKSLYDIVTFSRWPSEGPLPSAWNSDLEPMPVIADVHTDANSGLVLEEGVGHPYDIYVICEIEGRAVLTRGAAFSYYEFTWPMNDRLTDEKWREMLLQTPAPEPPSWTASFIVSGNKPEGFHPDFYMWEKPNSSTITVDIKPEEPRIGDNITVTMSTNEWAPGDPPIVRYTLPQSQDSRQVENLIVENPNAGPWIATIPTTGMNPGKLYIDIAKAFFPDTLKYRASVEVLRGTDVGENEQSGPVSFTLYQNRPNPFNATTAIGFDLSEQNRIQLDIFDINGRFVRRLLTGTFGAGSHTVLWDGTDEVGGVKSSGVYYYRLLTEGHMDVKRMLLLK